VEQHVDWARAAISSLVLPVAVRRRLKAQADEIEGRIHDPELRIAVFGEFSSGKSTLINAIVRNRLLPSSALVTTRAVTVLRHDERGAAIRAQIGEGRWVTWPSAAFERWAGRHLPHRDDVPSQADYLVRLLTTAELAGRLRSLEVKLSEPMLGGGIALIDTPGFNVADREHRELAKDAARRADLALIVTPGIAPISMTLADFVVGALHNHIDRCAFVVTKMDLVEPQERDEVLDTIRVRLRKLGLDGLRMIPCAPEPALRAAVADGGPELDSFVDVEQQVVRLAVELRDRAINATLTRLLGGLLLAVSDLADRERHRLTAAEESLVQLPVVDLDDFLARWRKGAVRAAQRSATAALESFDAAGTRSALDARLRTALAGEAASDLRSAAKTGSRAAQEQLRSAAEAALGEAARRASSSLDSSKKALGRDFRTQFGTLAGLAGRTRAIRSPSVASAAVSLPVIPDLDETLRDLASKLTAISNWKSGGGAAAGLAAGTAIAPGPGSLIGLAIGWWMGTTDKDRRRKQFMEKAGPQLDAAVAQTAKAVRAGVKVLCRAVEKNTATVADGYRRTYGSAVASLVAAEARKRAELRNAILTAEAVVAEADRRGRQVLGPGVEPPSKRTTKRTTATKARKAARQRSSRHAQ
jgi:GTPase SAR1 family protein